MKQSRRGGCPRRLCRTCPETYVNPELFVAPDESSETENSLNRQKEIARSLNSGAGPRGSKRNEGALRGHRSLGAPP